MAKKRKAAPKRGASPSAKESSKAKKSKSPVFKIDNSEEEDDDEVDHSSVASKNSLSSAASLLQKKKKMEQDSNGGGNKEKQDQQLVVRMISGADQSKPEKFWEIYVVKNNVRVHYGKYGEPGPGKEDSKSFASNSVAVDFANKQINAKKDKGFYLPSQNKETNGGDDTVDKTTATATATSTSTTTATEKKPQS